jgi:preprotein translocase subunit SecE
VEEVLPALQQAPASQGNEVTGTAEVARAGFAQRVVTFFQDMMTELRKVTWPDKGQVRQLSIGVIVLSLFIGAVIALIDVILQQLLVRWIPSLFGG